MDLPADLSVASLFIALVGGAASFVSPCVLPLLPAYLSFVSGLSVEEARKSMSRTEPFQKYPALIAKLGAKK